MDTTLQHLGGLPDLVRRARDEGIDPVGLRPRFAGRAAGGRVRGALAMPSASASRKRDACWDMVTET
jgi:hypothetical protein